MAEVAAHGRPDAAVTLGDPRTGSDIEPQLALVRAERTHLSHPRTLTTHPRPIAPTMSSILARSALRAAPRLHPTPAFRRWASAAAEGERQAGKQALKTGAKRDPELYVLFAIMSGVFGLAGWHFCEFPAGCATICTY